jgi:hypothetical protein
VAAILEAAGALGERRDLLGRPVLVMLFGAEEWGLRGSRALAREVGKDLTALVNLDTVGGLVALLGVMQQLEECSDQERVRRLGKIGTIDLRVDYLRSGLGREFFASGFVLRTGNKVAVTRMELHNEKESLLAVGTGTYIVG